MVSKKTCLIVAFVACWILVGVFVYRSYFKRNSYDIPNGILIGVKCTNPKCKAEYQIELRDYQEYLSNNEAIVGEFQLPCIVCEKCGEKSAYEVFNCDKCGKVSFPGSMGPTDFRDRCSYCGYSKTEEARKKASNK